MCAAAGLGFWHGSRYSVLCSSLAVAALWFRVPRALFLPMRFLSTFTSDMRSASLAQASAMRTLCYGPSFLVDVGEIPILWQLSAVLPSKQPCSPGYGAPRKLTTMLTITDTVTSHTGFTRPFLAVNQHGESLWIISQSERSRDTRSTRCCPFVSDELCNFAGWNF